MGRHFFCRSKQKNSQTSKTVASPKQNTMLLKDGPGLRPAAACVPHVAFCMDKQLPSNGSLWHLAFWLLALAPASFSSCMLLLLLSSLSLLLQRAPLAVARGRRIFYNICHHSGRNCGLDGNIFFCEVGARESWKSCFGPEIRAGVPGKQTKIHEIHGKRARTLKDKFLRSLRSRI